MVTFYIFLKTKINDLLISLQTLPVHYLENSLQPRYFLHLVLRSNKKPQCSAVPMEPMGLESNAQIIRIRKNSVAVKCTIVFFLCMLTIQKYLE